MFEIIIIIRCSAIATGASSSGKSSFFSYVITDTAGHVKFENGADRFDKIVVCFSVFDELYKSWLSKSKSIHFYHGLPSQKDFEAGKILSPDETNLLVLEDQDDFEQQPNFIRKLFTIYSHHFK